MKLEIKLKQLFCKHKWKNDYIVNKMSLSEMMLFHVGYSESYIPVLKCEKCGKIKYV